MTTDLPVPVARLVAASNNGDTTAFLASFSANGIVDDWGREFVGTDSIKEWSDAEFIGKQVTLSDIDATGDDPVVVKAQVGGNGFNGPSTFSFIITADRIAKMTIRA